MRRLADSLGVRQERARDRIRSRKIDGNRVNTASTVFSIRARFGFRAWLEKNSGKIFR